VLAEAALSAATAVRALPEPSKREINHFRVLRTDCNIAGTVLTVIGGSTVVAAASVNVWALVAPPRFVKAAAASC
jgi:hypothetical protein